jgi:hypothetical protein
LREEVLSQIPSIFQKRVTASKLSLIISEFQKHILESKISENECIEINAAVAAAVFRDFSWSFNTDSETKQIHLRRCNLDIDLVSLFGMITLPNYPNVASIVECNDFLDYIYECVVENMKQKLPDTWRLILNSWMSSRVLLDKVSHLKTISRGNSNMSKDKKQFCKFFSIPSVGASQDSFQIAIGIYGYNLNNSHERSIKEAIWNAAMIVYAYFAESRNDVNSFDLYKESEAHVHQDSEKPAQVTANGGPMFSLLTALLFVYANNNVLSPKMPLEGRCYLAMETFNGKKTNMKVSCKAEKGEKLELNAIENQFDEMLEVNHSQRVANFILYFALGLDDAKLLINIELLTGLGATVEGFNDYGSPALVCWNVLKFKNELAELQNPSKNAFIPKESRSFANSNFDEENDEFPKAYSCRYKEFVLHRIYPTIQFYFPFHGMLPLQCCFTATNLRDNKYYDVDINHTAIWHKLQTYLPDIR